MRIVILHDDDCPLGTNGLRAYQEAREALATMPPEARRTNEDITDIAVAEFELELLQKCNCGAEEAKNDVDVFLGYIDKKMGKAT